MEGNIMGHDHFLSFQKIKRSNFKFNNEYYEYIEKFLMKIIINQI